MKRKTRYELEGLQRNGSGMPMFIIARQYSKASVFEIMYTTCERGKLQSRGEVGRRGSEWRRAT